MSNTEYKKLHMPAEWEPHQGTIMIYPNRTGSWGDDLESARTAFLPVYREILKDEDLYLVCKDEAQVIDAEEKIFNSSLLLPHKVHPLIIPTDDNWARDITPSFVVNEDRTRRVAHDFTFNAWGGDYNGLYLDYEQADAFGAKLARALGDPCESVRFVEEEMETCDAKKSRDIPFVLEGGSIHVDGECTCMVTEACLMSPGRNPSLSQEEIEDVLKQSLGVKKILWLPRGIYQDETDEHVDNVCCFLKPGEVLLNWCEDSSDPQYPLTQETYRYLENATDARGRKLTIHKLPMPTPVYVTEDEAAGFTFAEGEDMREPGERLAASYVNFLRTNGAVLMPQFDCKEDEKAVKIMEKLLPELRIVPIPARKFLLGGGNMHCLSHELPAVGKQE